MPQMYRPMAQWPVPILSLMVRTTIDPLQLAPAVRQAIWDIAADVPISDLRLFDSLIAGSVRQPRLVAGLLAGFGALALLLGVVGVYGVLSYVVGQRRREFGIRLALGARRVEILGIVLRHALPVALLGVTIGVGAAWAGTRLLRSQLYELSPGDPLTLAVAAATLIGTAMLAALGPARAAARVDPVQSMRGD
jgi:ABC-type antimicrobial peptide transport system permease subunit